MFIDPILNAKLHTHDSLPGEILVEVGPSFYPIPTQPTASHLYCCTHDMCVYSVPDPSDGSKTTVFTNLSAVTPIDDSYKGLTIQEIRTALNPY